MKNNNGPLLTSSAAFTLDLMYTVESLRSPIWRKTHQKNILLQDIKHCYISRLSLNWTGTAIGWFLVTWPWLKSNVSWSWYIKQCTPLGIHYSTWSSMVESGVTEGRKNTASFLFREWTQQHKHKASSQKQRFLKLSQKRNSS